MTDSEVFEPGNEPETPAETPRPEASATVSEPEGEASVTAQAEEPTTPTENGEATAEAEATPASAEAENVTENAPAEAEANAETSPKDGELHAVARKDMTYREWLWKEIKKNRVAYLLIAPYVLVFTIFTIIPVVLSVVISFTDFNMLQWPSFVGIDNYINLFFADDIFLIACKNTLIFAMIVGPVSYLMSFLVAWFINELSPRIRSIVTLIFYAPSISGQVYLIWGTLFSADSYGWVNATLMEIGFIDEPIAWFKDEDYVMGLCIVVALWTSLGTSFLSFIAGLQGIDRSLYEAGAVDGVRNRWQELWYITLPSMKPQLMFGAIMAITGSFGFGSVVTALCGFPSVNYAAHTIMHHLEDYGNQRYEIGYSSAIATVLFLIMIAANLVVKKIISKVGS